MGSEARPAAGARVVLGCAVAGVILWSLLLTGLHPTWIGDETYYVPAVRELLAGRTEAVARLSITPTYLYLAAGAASVLGTSLWSLRGLNTGLAVLALCAGYAAVRGRDPETAAGRLAALALHPLLVPLWALFYTDMPALAALLTAVAAQQRGRHALSAAAGLAAVLIRQSNLTWLAYLLASAVTTPPRGLRRGWPYVLALAAAAGLGATGVLRVLPNLDNGPRVNPAQGYLFLLTAAVLWLPHWGPTLVRALPALLPRLAQPAVAAATVIVAALLALGFTNPHPWNTDLSFLRNWPLVALERWPGLRVAAALVVMAFVVTQVRRWRSSGRRRELGLLWLFSILFLAPQWLVDWRYHAPPLVLIDLGSGGAAATWWRLSAWYGILAAGVAAYVLLRPGGGMI